MGGYLNYTYHKAFVLVLSLIIVLGSLLFEDLAWQWKYIIAAYIILGYSHFIVGYLYQHKSLRRKNSRSQILSKILIPNIILMIVIYLLLTNNDLYIIFFVFIIFYFLLHGYFNDKTIFRKFTGDELPKNTFLVILLDLVLFSKSLIHPSVLVNIKIDSQIAQLISTQGVSFIPTFFASVYPMMIIISLIAYVLYLVKRKKAKNKLEQVITLSFIPLLILIAILPVISFIHLLAFILIYHFLEWTFFSYYQIHTNKKKEIGPYVIITLISFLPFLILFGIYHFASTNIIIENLYLFLFDPKTFVALTFFHISTSFFNEDSMKKILKIK